VKINENYNEICMAKKMKYEIRRIINEKEHGVNVKSDENSK